MSKIHVRYNGFVFFLFLICSCIYFSGILFPFLNNNNNKPVFILDEVSLTIQIRFSKLYSAVIFLKLQYFLICYTNLIKKMFALNLQAKIKYKSITSNLTSVITTSCQICDLLGHKLLGAFDLQLFNKIVNLFLVWFGQWI